MIRLLIKENTLPVHYNFTKLHIQKKIWDANSSKMSDDCPSWSHISLWDDDYASNLKTYKHIYFYLLSINIKRRKENLPTLPISDKLTSSQLDYCLISNKSRLVDYYTNEYNVLPCSLLLLSTRNDTILSVITINNNTKMNVQHWY